MIITEAHELTPVEKRGDYCFKRDDLFVPFSFSPVNGSKLRQAILLCEKNAQRVSNGIYTGTSIHSPQAVICASVAKQKNVPCHIVFGGTDERHLIGSNYYALCKYLGAHTHFVSSGRTAVVSKYANDLANSAQGFCVKYGFDLNNNVDVFIESVAQQVQNIPDVRNLVITIGSAITITGVLLGIAKYGKQIQRIIGVGCAPDRMQKIREYANLIKSKTGYDLPIERLQYIDCYNRLKGFKYENTINKSYCGIVFHPRYEAKTFAFMEKYVPKNNTLMWITGHEL